MNEAQIELLTYRVLTGVLYFEYMDEQYELRSPSFEIRYKANILYEKTLNDEKFNVWIREEDAAQTMITLGLWNKETNKLIKDLEKRIENLKVDLYQSAIDLSKNQKVRKTLSSAKDQLNRILSTKSEFFVSTLEGYASSIKNEYIVCKTLFKNNKLVFDSTSGKVSANLFNNIVSEINKYIISVSNFKEIARSSLWRAYWNGGKDSVFRGSVSEWTDDQRTLVNVSRMYDSIYEHPECPSDKVIEDEDMLDGWMIVQKRKTEKMKNEKAVDELNPNLKNAQEVFLMARGAESAESIMALNSPEAKQRLQEKMNYIQSKGGEVNESELPDVRRELMNQRSEMLKNRK